MIRVGHSVLLHGLQRESDLNGISAEVIGYNHEKCRWLVRILGSEKQLYVKEENLKIKKKDRIDQISFLALLNQTRHNPMMGMTNVLQTMVEMCETENDVYEHLQIVYDFNDSNAAAILSMMQNVGLTLKVAKRFDLAIFVISLV